MPRKPKDISRFVERLRTKPTAWDYKNLGKQYEQFKESDMYLLLKWEVEDAIEEDRKNSISIGSGPNSYDYLFGYHTGLSKLFNIIDQRIIFTYNILEDERAKRKESKKVEEESDNPDEPLEKGPDSTSALSL